MNKTKRFDMWMSVQLWEWLTKKAERVSVAQYIRNILWIKKDKEEGR